MYNLILNSVNTDELFPSHTQGNSRYVYSIKFVTILQIVY